MYIIEVCLIRLITFASPQPSDRGFCEGVCIHHKATIRWKLVTHPRPHEILHPHATHHYNIISYCTCTYLEPWTVGHVWLKKFAGLLKLFAAAKCWTSQCTTRTVAKRWCLGAYMRLIFPISPFVGFITKREQGSLKQCLVYTVECLWVATLIIMP